MSRIGKQPIVVPKEVTVSIADGAITVKGPKGSASRCLDSTIEVTIVDDQVVVSPRVQTAHARAMYGTTRALIANMVTGVTTGFTSQLEIVGVGYRALLKGSTLVLNIGFCHPVEIEAPEGVQINCPDQTHITISGIDKQQVGHLAAVIRAVRKPEPYKGKGIRYQGEAVRRKAGKAAK